MRPPLLVLGLIAALTGCKGSSTPPPDQRVPDRSVARKPATERPRPDAGPPGPLALQRLTVAGFQRAELVERKDADEAHWGKVSTRSFSVKGQGREWKRVVEIHLGRRSPRSLRGYLGHWRASHGCTVRVVHDLPRTMRGLDAPPQLTFTGVCKGGDAYIIRVLLLGDIAYELHADSLVRGGSLRPRFLELLSAVSVPSKFDGVRRQLKDAPPDRALEKVFGR